MYHILVASGAQFALKISRDQLQKYIDNQVDRQVIERTQNIIQEEIRSILGMMWSRTRIYVIFSIINILGCVAYFTFKNPIYLYALLFVSGSFLLTYVYKSIVSFLRILNYAENFESHLKEIITEEFKIAKSENLKTKLALFLKSRNLSDYYNLILGQIVKSLSHWLIQNKKLLYIRLLTYFVASASFSFSFREIFIIVF